jgi:hypothetical protein
MRTVVQNGELFCECPRKDWQRVLAEWKADHSKPCPMPVGHIMFRKERGGK